MDRKSQILLFGDQTGDYRIIFRQILQIKENVILTSFFEKAYCALRDEVAQQPRAVRDHIPDFTSIADLVARYEDSNAGKNNAIESTLACLSQISCFICSQGDGAQGYPSPSNTCIIGSCTGLLAAAAVSSSQSLVDLISAAIEVLRIAFRVGVRVTEVRDQIEHGFNDPSWSAIVSGIEEPDAIGVIDSFNDEKCIPTRSRAYISAISPSSLTISGPHGILDELLEYDKLKNLKANRIRIHGPYHAPHLYKEDEPKTFVQSISSKVLESHIPRIPIRSTGTREWFSAANLGHLLEGVLQDVLMRTIRWDDVLESVSSKVKDSGHCQCSVLRLGPSNTGQSLVSALRQDGNFEVSLDDRFVGELEHIGVDESSGRLAHSKIAICGLSGRFPDAASPEAFWKLLEKGLDLHREVPKDRFNVSTHVDVDGKRANTSHTPFGCFIKDPGLFDPRFFGISPREAAQTDPMQRLALVTAYEALEMSGYVPNRTPSTQQSRIGTFYGQTSDDWREIQAAQKVDTYFIPGGVRAFGPGRINYYFKFSGPSFNIDTACSSSLAAIQLACTSLWAGDCDTALAGGMNVLTNPDIFSGLSRGQFLSKKGSCQTFDNDADGYCRADGVGTVILKRLEDAKADKDPILAVILGSATNHSAEAVSITHPHAGAQEFLYKHVLNAACVDPHDVSYVEMHGTGTQAGDATEMQSVTNVFAPENRRRRPDQQLYLGAVKANAGHAEAASGITSLIKCLLMLDKNLIPPHCGIKGKINRTFPKNLDERNVHIPFKLTTWDRPEGGKRRLFLNNFSAAGGNTALLLEDAPPTQITSEKKDPRSHHIVAVSAKSKYSLKQNIISLLEILGKTELDLPSLSYTTTARRIQHNYRVTVSGDSNQKMRDALASWKDQDCSPISTAKPDIIFAFTGQGAHYAEMGKQLFETCTQFRIDIEKYDAIGISQGFPSIQPLIDGTVTDIQNLSTVVVQLGAACVQMALFKLWESWGIHPTAVVGHSLGEYAALCAARVTSVSDTIFLVGKRAKLLEEQCHSGSHAMLAVKCSVASISPFLDSQTFEVACINAPEEIVLSGTNINIDILSEDLKERGFKSTKLAVPYAFHSAQVESILDNFETAATGVTFNVPIVPVISPLLNEVIKNERNFDPCYLRRHCRETVNFLGGLEAARHSKIAEENTIWIEIGSHPVCSSMIKATFGPSVKTVPTLRRKEDNWKVLTSSLCILHSAGLNIDWSEYHRDFSSSHTLLGLPTYSWENKNYWIDYTNDWCLAKGDQAIAAEIPSQKSKLSNASVHRIIEENFEGDTPTIIIESNLAHPDLKEAIKGHEVNGFGLCPPSLYADMALTIAEYVYKEKKPEVDHVDLNVCNMKVEKPLIVDDREYQCLQVSGNADMAFRKIDFVIYSVNAEGKKTTHATCAVKYEDANTWIAGWARSRFMVRTRVESLIAGVHSGKHHLIRRGMVYKLFGGLIHYGTKYQGMEEVILDSSQLEATSSVAFQPGANDASFFISPYVIDSVAHLSGFIMLANDNADTSKDVYVSHGWENCRVARPFQMDKKYRSYVKMEKAGEKTVIGDVYVFDEEDSIVAVVEGLQFHCLPRQLLDSILSATGGKPKAVSTPKAISPPQKSTNSNATSPPQKATNPNVKPKSETKSSPNIKSTNSTPPKLPGNVTTGAINICAEEIGVSVTELLDESSFADMGMDSLLSLTVSGKFREAFNIDVPSSLFLDYPTVKDLKGYLAQYDSGSDKSNVAPEAEISSSTESASGTTTPIPETESQTSIEDGEEAAKPESDSGERSALIRSTIAGEMGVAVEEIDGSTDLAGLGMDSLMSLQVLGKLRENLGEDLPSDFLTEHTTFGEIERSLNPNPKPSPSPTKQAAKKRPEGSENGNNQSKPDNKPLPSATSILIQGNPKSTSKTLFLFPDGSGSATSYSQLPNLSPDLAIYGLNCPFIKCPEDYTIGIPGVSNLYLAEVRRRQPHGPYVFGGWSAGGVCAYEATLQMLAQGDVVERLVLLDAPCPIHLDPLPSHLHDFFDSINLLGPEGNPDGPPGWLLPHFDHSIANLSAYKPKAVDPAKAPRTYALWATDGVCKNPEDPRPKPEGGNGAEPESMKWLLDNRTDLKYNRWNQLIPTDKFERMESVTGVNHFTMMRKPGVNDVGAFIRQALA